MTELEFAVSQLLGSAPAPSPSMSDCGATFKALRAFRALLFKDAHQIVLPDLLPLQSGLAPEFVAHHIVVRSQSILLPHEMHKWSRSEYLKWLDSHSHAADAMELIKGTLDAAKADEEARSADDTVWLNALQGWIELVQSQPSQQTSKST